MTQHVVRIGSRNEQGFRLHLLSDETLHTEQEVDAMLEIIRESVTSPFGRSAIEFLCPTTKPFVKDALRFTMQRLLNEHVPGIRSINNIRIISHLGFQLPSPRLASHEAPLVCFSVARLSCLLYGMALANVRYPGMEGDFAAWLHDEQVLFETESEAGTLPAFEVPARKLTDYGSSIEAELLQVGYPWHYPLSRITPIFQCFVWQIENCLRHQT